MGAIRNFFDTMGSNLGGAIMPGAYLQGQGIDPEQQKAIQQAALRQFGMGLLGSVGTGAPIGPRLGQAFHYAGENAQGQVAQAAQQSRFNRQENRADMQDLERGNQLNLENAARQRGALDAEARFNIESKQRQQQLDDASRHATAMEGYAKTSADASAAEALSMAQTRKAALERQVAQDKEIAAIYADKTLSPDQKTRALQDASLKFSGGVYNYNPLAALGQLLTPQPGAPAAPGATATAPTGADAIIAARRAAGR